MRLLNVKTTIPLHSKDHHSTPLPHQPNWYN